MVLILNFGETTGFKGTPRYWVLLFWRCRIINLLHVPVIFYTDPVEGWLVNNFKDCFPDTIVHIILNLSHPKQEDAGFDKIAWNYAPNGVLKTIFFISF